MVKIFIDPGHGGIDPGAMGNGLKEKDLTLKISTGIKEYLDKFYTGHETVLSRMVDTTLSLKQRTDKANKWGADYLLSVHINAGGGTGYEDFIYNGKITNKTLTARSTMHSEISTAVKWKDRGQKTANFHMLRESKMPAILTESGFIDTKADADLLKLDSTITALIKGHAEGLVKTFKLPKKTVTTPTTGKLYRVQVGAFSKKSNAEKVASELQQVGFDVYIKYE